MKETISIGLVLALGLATEVARADFTFGPPTNLGPTVNSSYNEFNTSISADGLSLYFISNRPGGVGGTGTFAGLDIWVTTRETANGPWGTPVNLGPTVNSTVGEAGVSISSDGLSLYLDTLPPGSSGAEDLYVATRATTDDEWGVPVNLGPAVNSSADDCYVDISADGLELYFTANRAGGSGNYDLWVTKRETIFDPWGTPLNLGPTVNSSTGDGQTSISADGRMLFFVSSRSGGYGNGDIWLTSRATTDAPWGEPVNLGSTINSSGWDEYPNVSADGSTLYFRTSQSGRWGNDGDIWQAPIIPIVDLNGDEFVGIDDLLILIENWGTNETLCDIGPMPWGDGIVDARDLEVLMSHWQEEVPPVSLLAYWTLDETEGILAHDSTGGHDATVMGAALWQPDGGCVDGALEFDGATFVVADFVLSPSDGPFSVLAWVQGGGPGQVILAQAGKRGGANWLMTDAAGALMTELKSSRGVPLVSAALVVDGQWHRVGLVWDGVLRTLYVDGVEVARDTEGSGAPVGANTGLYLGAGNTLDAGSFFSGLIDDVRVYNRAVKP